MATVTVNYTNWTSIAITAVTTTLAAAEFASSAVVDNTSNKFVDALVGGAFATGASHTTGNTINVYAWGNYDTATSTDIGGGIAALFAGADQEETKDTDFIVENFPLLGVVTADLASKTIHWGPWSVASAFGGVLPQKWGLLIENNGAGAMAAGSSAGYVGIKFDSA